MNASLTQAGININKARLEASLNRLYNFRDKGTMPLEKFLSLYPPVNKSVDVQKYSARRIRLEYKKLANPRTIYTAWIDDTYGVAIPKIVWDWLACPIRT
jgi:hypothetical protein